jgi:aminoglycoside phosphotransferase (APT) family kinase protein
VGVAGHYARLQVDLAPHADQLLRAGVADMRPGRMEERFDEAVAVARPASDAQADALRRVAALRSRFQTWCDRLAASSLPPSLDHNDLHAGNVFVDASGEPRFFDWGDAVLSHPFASALVLRSVVRWLQDVHVETPVERRILDAYLEPFDGDPAEHRELIDVACEVGKVARSLVWARAVAPMPADADDPDDFRGAPTGWLLELLEGPLAHDVKGSTS